MGNCSNSSGTGTAAHSGGISTSASYEEQLRERIAGRMQQKRLSQSSPQHQPASPQHLPASIQHLSSSSSSSSDDDSDNSSVDSNESGKKTSETKEALNDKDSAEEMWKQNYEEHLQRKGDCSEYFGDYYLIQKLKLEIWVKWYYIS